MSSINWIIVIILLENLKSVFVIKTKSMGSGAGAAEDTPDSAHRCRQNPVPVIFSILNLSEIDKKHPVVIFRKIQKCNLHENASAKNDWSGE